MKKLNELRYFFDKNNGVATSQELLCFGLTHYLIAQLVKNGTLERIKRGTFILGDSEEDEHYIAQQIVPQSIFCLLSAASIYNYTTYIPNQYYLAIRGNYYSQLPDYPPIQLYYWRKKQFELGTAEMTLNNSTIRIYNKEKTVCDFIRFRNKLDSNVVKEVLKSYLKDKYRNLTQLNNYSKKLRIESVLNNYLEILL